MLGLGLGVTGALALACAGDPPAPVDPATTPLVIVVAPDAVAPEVHAAAELSQYLSAMTGSRVPVVCEDSPDYRRVVYVGPSAQVRALGINDGELGEEEYVLKTAGNRLAAVGGRPRGTLYACYGLLDRLGVRWLTRKVTILPRQPAFEFPDLDLREAPAFDYREPFFAEAFDGDWAVRNRCNGNAARLDEARGGKIAYYPFVHTFEQLVPRTLYDSHPEYFPLINGSRFGGFVQRCLTNPDVLRLSIERVKEWAARTPGTRFHSVSQNDVDAWCDCDGDRAIRQQYGGYAGLNLWFVNQVAAEVERDYPDRLVDTLAYQRTEPPPQGIAPRHNVRVRLCPLACCMAHPFETCSDANNQSYLKALRGWAALTDKLYVWHYGANFDHYLAPFPDFRQFADSLRLYRQNGVRGLLLQGAYARGGGGADSELRAWVTARLLWDPYQDAAALVTQWMQGVYGEAWEPMRAWFDALHDHFSLPSRHLHVFDAPTPQLFPAELLARGRSLIKEAERLAASNATATEYITRSRLQLNYVEVAQRRASRDGFDKFISECKGLGITELRESRPIETWAEEYRASAFQG